MHILVLGGSGQLGTQLRALALQHGVVLRAPPRAEIDLADCAAIRRIVAAEPWDVVIDAAGYTNVDRAESEEDVAFAINADAAACLATETAKQQNSSHLHFDRLCFRWRQGRALYRDDAAAPLNAYGRSKLAGERGVSPPMRAMLSCARHGSLAPHGTNFVRTILRLAQEREVSHHRCRPAWLPDLGTRFGSGLSGHSIALRGQP